MGGDETKACHRLEFGYILGVLYITANLYCICVSACLKFAEADAVHIYGNIRPTQNIEENTFFLQISLIAEYFHLIKFWSIISSRQKKSRADDPFDFSTDPDPTPAFENFGFNLYLILFDILAFV